MRVASRVIHLTEVPQCRDAGEIDDSAPASFAHVGLDSSTEQEVSAKVDSGHRIPIIYRHLSQHVVACDAGVIDQDRRTSQLVRDRRCRVGDGLFVADVSRDRDSGAALVLDCRGT